MAHEKRDFPVVLTVDEDGAYAATCPLLPAAISGGATREEALENIREAIQLCLESGDKPSELAHVTVAA